MSLTERIEKREPQPEPQERKSEEKPKFEPVWLRRMRTHGLPDVDHTGDIKVAA